jgi:hypothetical protein
MDQITRNLAAAYPNADKGAGAAVLPLRDELVHEVRPYLWLLLGAVGFVLLIACVNVGNLQLARSTGRAHEFAIRCALGLSPRVTGHAEVSELLPVCDHPGVDQTTQSRVAG